jgi:aspartyl-tRNA(Asn)/glutamyl-tRNA(Gln) amidotransferase subunit B
VRPVGQKEFGTRCEIKNLNSFRFLEDAINYEVRRQIELIEDGGRVVQATRLYDPDKKETREMRSKEDAQDYRYFPDPDLPPLVIAQDWIERIKASMPELPGAMRERFVRDHALSSYDAAVLTQSKAMAAYFEAVVAITGKEQAKTAANWLMGEVARRLNIDSIPMEQCPVPATALAAVITRVADGKISNNGAKQVFEDLWNAPQNADGTRLLQDVDDIITARGLEQISDSGALEKIVDDVLAANAKSVDEYRSGKEKAFNALIGQAMKASKGKANPAQLTELLKKKLAG